MSTSNSNPSLLERILAYATLTIVLVAVASYITTLIVGMNDREALALGLWPFITWLATVGLPIGFVLLLALLGINMTRRSREHARSSERAASTRGGSAAQSRAKQGKKSKKRR